MSNARRGSLLEELSQAESDLEDVRLFRPRPEEIRRAEERVAALRAELARLDGAQPSDPPRAPDPLPPPPAPPSGDAPAPPATQPAFEELLTNAWLADMPVNRDAVFQCVRANGHVTRPEAVRLREAAFTHLFLQGYAVPHRTGPAPAILCRYPAPARLLVDARDGLTLVERRLLIALQQLGALPESEPRPFEVIQRHAEERLGLQAEDDLLLAAHELRADKATALVESFSGTETSPRLRLTTLGTRLVSPLDDLALRPDQPLPARVPYMLLAGRLGDCTMRLPFVANDVLWTTWRRVSGLPEELSGPQVPLAEGLVPSFQLHTPTGLVTIAAFVEPEVSFQERRAQVVVRRLPPGPTWRQAREHLERLRTSGQLDGVTSTRIVALPSDVLLVLELEHVIFTRHVEVRVRAALSCEYAVHQKGLIDEQVIELTPSRALDLFIEHRLRCEANANNAELRRLAREQELLEGTLVAIELGEVLTSVLRTADASTELELASWALEHLPSCASHPALSALGGLAGHWRRAVDAMVERVRREEPSWSPSVAFVRGFSHAQAQALYRGRAVHRDAREVVDELVRVHLARARELSQTFDQQVRRRVASELDLLRVQTRLE